MRNGMNIIKGIGAIGAALLMVTLTACGGSGSVIPTSSGSNPSGSNGNPGGNNNTPPGIPNSIVFAPPASTNTVIALQGTGGKTNADVTFQVNDASNTGVSGVPVTFALVPSTGDATLTTTTGTTGTNGQVATFVVSGNEHYSVTVLAKVSTPSGVKTASSNSLTISTGIPTEGNFSMASGTLTANNAASTQGITDTITVQLSDRFYNPAPDGTAVAFTANAGQIPGQCLTKSGSCTVTWSSSGLPNPIDALHQPGQVEILAYTVGEESFDDVDGDGVFDHNDVFTVFQGSGKTDDFSEPNDPGVDDIGEVYLDGAENGAYISGDFFHDFNNDGLRNPPDGKYYGFGCKGTATVSCGSTATKEIGKQVCVNMSTGGAKITSPSGPITVSGTGTGGVNVTFTVTDQNNHALASGTSVTLNSTITNGTVALPIDLPFTYQDSGCGTDIQTFTVNITQTAAVPPAAPLPVSGTIQLVVVTPGAGGSTTRGPVITLQ